MKSIFFAILFSLFIPAWVHAQPPTLHQCLDELSASRKPIKSYTVKMRGVASIRDGLTTIPGGPSIDFIHKIELEMAANLEQGRTLIIQQINHAFPAIGYRGERPSNDARSTLYLIDGSTVHRLVNGQFQASDLSSLSCPDPLTLGVGFCAETTGFVPFKQAVSNLYLWQNDDFKLDQSGARTTFRIPRSTHISFDRAKGSMIRSIGLRNGDNSIEVLGEVEPILVDKVWLPKRVSYICGAHQFFTWELDWISVNQPLHPDVFDKERLTVWAAPK